MELRKSPSHIRTWFGQTTFSWPFLDRRLVLEKLTQFLFYMFTEYNSVNNIAMLVPFLLHQ